MKETFRLFLFCLFSACLSVLTPNPARKSFQIRGRHLPESSGGDENEYRCIVYIEGTKHTTVGVFLESNLLECQANTVINTALFLFILHN